MTTPGLTIGESVVTAIAFCEAAMQPDMLQPANLAGADALLGDLDDRELRRLMAAFTFLVTTFAQVHTKAAPIIFANLRERALAGEFD